MDQIERNSTRSADPGVTVDGSEPASEVSNRTPSDDNALRRTWSRVFATSAVLLAGAASGFYSWLLQSSEPWWSGMLGNLSVTIVLLVPAEIALTWIRRGFRSIQNRTEAIREIAESARVTAESTEESLAEVRAEILGRQRHDYDEYVDTFRKMGSESSRDSLVRGLKVASDRGLTANAGVRSPVWGTDLHYRFLLDDEATSLQVRLESDDGTVLSEHPWPPAMPAAEFYQQLVEAVRAAGADLGVGLNDPTNSVQDLSEMLVEVAELHSQELLGYRDHLKGIIERVDGWYFTERAVLPKENLKYTIAVKRLNEFDEISWEEHLRGKGWYEAESMLPFARRLYGLPTAP